MNKIKIVLFGLICASTVLSFTLFAESTAVTSKGTFRCPNACVVDENGGVTDSQGEPVWKMIVPEAPKTT